MSLARKLGDLFSGNTDNNFLPMFPSGVGPIPHSLPTLPPGWIWADGAVLLSSTPYTSLRAAYIAAGFPYGQDGSGNPKVPDMRGRVPAGKDNMGGTPANRLTTAGADVDGATLGATGGAQTHTLTSAQIPAHSHPVTDPTHSHSESTLTGGAGGGSFGVGDNGLKVGATTSSSATGITVGNNTGGGGAHPIVQPTMVCNYIIKT